MADTVNTSSGSTRKPDDNASEIIEQRNASLRYFTNNYYEEWRETYRTVKVRTEPIMRKNRAGEMVEDTSRTNVCLPDHFVMMRHGVARLTRNPPNLRLRGDNQEAAQKAAGLLMYQWDRGKAQKQFRKIVQSAKVLGWGVGKSYYDKIEVERRFRRSVDKMSKADLMLLQGAEADDVPDEAHDQPLSAEEQQSTIANHGDSPAIPQLITKYEGPLLNSVFPGDFFPEPGFQSLPDSAYLIENSNRDDDWLEYWTKQESINPWTGESEGPVITPKAAQDLMDVAGNRNYLDEKTTSLRRMMREAVGVADPTTAGKPLKAPKKRFMIDERHSIVKGHLLIEFVGEDSIYAGRMWYPWPTNGEPVFTDMVLIPDLIEGIGDSTPRVTRFLMQMRNTRVNQTTDAINNRLRPMFKVIEGDNFTDSDLVRTGWGRVLTVQSMDQVEPMVDPVFPAEAFEDQAQLIREMQAAEPAMQDFQPGSEAMPGAGKLATTAVLQSKAADAITADELNCMAQFTHDTMGVWLAFDQHAMEDPVTIAPQASRRTDQLFFPKGVPGQENGSVQATGLTVDNSPKSITIDPMDIQEEFEIIPEEGSTLADDDEYRIGKLQQAYALASQDPTIWNKRAIAMKLAAVIPGGTPEEFILPPPPAPPPPPPKVSINVAVKMEDQAPDVQSYLLEQMGAPHEGTAVLKTIKHGADAIQHVANAANAAADLESPAHPGGAEGASPNAVDSTTGVRAPKGLGKPKG